MSDIRGKHDDPATVAPVYTTRVHGSEYRSSNYWVADSEAAVRASPVAQSDVVLVREGRQFTWDAAGEPVRDDGTPTSNIVALSGVSTGAYVRDGYTYQTVPYGTGTATLWTCAVGTASTIQVTVDARCYSGSTASVASKHWRGQLACIAHRNGTASLSIDTQLASVPWLLTDSDWNPTFTTTANTLALQLTADDTQDITCRLLTDAEIETTADTIQPSLTPLQIARAAVLADSPTALYYSDVGLTPAAPSGGESISAWADQSGNVRHLTFTAGDQPTYGLDGSWPYINVDPAIGCTSAAAGAGLSQASFVIRWTQEKTANATPSAEIMFSSGAALYILAHGSGTGLGDGTNICIVVTGGTASLGPCPTGKHDLEIRYDHDAHTATLYTDGVAGTPASVTLEAAPSWMKIGYGGTTFPLNNHIYGWSHEFGSAGTDAKMNHWITMSQLAWGAHD